MLQIKDWVLIVGIVVAYLGYECIPTGQSVNPKLNLSFFAQTADAGGFLSTGLIMLAIGLLIAVGSFFIPRK